MLLLQLYTKTYIENDFFKYILIIIDEKVQNNQYVNNTHKLSKNKKLWNDFFLACKIRNT